MRLLITSLGPRYGRACRDAPMTEQRDTQLLRMHRRRLAAWDMADGPAEDEIVRPTYYERQVIDRAERVLDGRGYAIAHPHQQKEMGMCEECDAAALVERWRSPDA